MNDNKDPASAPVAFGITVAAGAATWVGAAVVFVPFLVKQTSARFLAAALSFSAGVLLYVSMIDIFGESVEGFETAGISSPKAYLYATICYFGGMIAIKVIDFVVFYLNKMSSRQDVNKYDDHSSDGVFGKDGEPEQVIDIDLEGNRAIKTDDCNKPIIPHCVGCSKDPLTDLQELKKFSEIEQKLQLTKRKRLYNVPTLSSNSSDHNELFHQEGGISPSMSHENCCVIQEPPDEHDLGPQLQTSPEINNNEHSEKAHDVFKTHDSRKLVRTGISVGLAIALHNFPEGFATFFAALDDARIGAVLAVAIALHNIALGMCVCLPIYYATGQRWKGFLSGFLLGLTQPIAALIGWAISSESISDDKNAIMLSFAGGIMVMISLKELLPTAHRYDPDDSVVTYALISGMGIMALSLILLNIE